MHSCGLHRGSMWGFTDVTKVFRLPNFPTSRIFFPWPRWTQICKLSGWILTMLSNVKGQKQRTICATMNNCLNFCSIIKPRIQISLLPFSHGRRLSPVSFSQNNFRPLIFLFPVSGDRVYIRKVRKWTNITVNYCLARVLLSRKGVHIARLNLARPLGKYLNEHYK